MNRTEFKDWLFAKGTLQPKAVSDYVSRCATIEKYEGDLDAEFSRDQLVSLLSKYEYTKSDKRNGISAKHNIPISGDIYNGTAGYRNSLKLYKQFSETLGGPVIKTVLNTKSAPANKKNLTKKGFQPSSWPIWDDASSDSIYRLAVEVVPYIRFLDPKIVEKIETENKKNRSNILDSLNNVGINPDLYMWDGSPCAFPGVRRSVGNNEKKGKWYGDVGFKENPQNKGTAIYLDDNDMPKEIWAFIFTGSYFRKEGPKGYSLAHIIDHKLDNNRMRDTTDKNGNLVPGEFGFKNNSYPFPLYGLFSSVANSAFITTSLMKPTDYNNDLRKLIIAKAFDLYSNCCNLVPEGITPRTALDPRFNVTNKDFKWAATVGDLSNISQFMEFRRLKYSDHGFPDMYK